MVCDVKKIKNNDLEICDISREEGCILKASVKITKDILLKMYQKGIDQVRENLEIPGYRKGKVSISQVISMKKETVLKAAREHLLNWIVPKILLHAKVTAIPGVPIKCKGVEHASFQEDCLDVLCTFECMPDIPIVQIAEFFKGVKLQEECFASEEEVQEAVDSIRSHYTKEKEVLRPSTEGDALYYRIKSEESDKRILLQADHLEKSLYDNLIGKKIGDVIDIPSVVLSDGTKCPKNVAIVSKVVELELPEITDEFVGQMGADGVEDFYEKIQKQVQSKANFSILLHNRGVVHRELVDKLTIDLPKRWVDNSIENIKKEAEQRNKSLTEEQIVDDAKKCVSSTCILQAIARHNGIVVNDNDIGQYLQRLLLLGRISIEEINSLVESKKNWKELLSGDVLADKVLDYIVFVMQGIMDES